MFVSKQLQHVGYKPQVARLASLGEQETEEEHRNVAKTGEEDGCSGVFGGFVGHLLSSMEVDSSDSPLGLTLGSVPGLLWPETPETESVWNRDFLQGRREPDSNMDTVSPSVDLQQAEGLTPDQTCLPQYLVEATLTGGYFPQIAALSLDTRGET